MEDALARDGLLIERPSIGWIGTGVMGSSMCSHLLAAGYDVCVFSRTPSKMAPLIEKGARSCSTVKALAERSDLIFTMVGFPKDVHDVYGGHGGLLLTARPGTILVDMTTSEPSLASSIYRDARKQGLQALDAPVSGGDIGAKEARLSIMVGGDDAIFRAVLPFFQVMGKTIVHQGPAGFGQHAKLVNQTLIASNMVGVCEALLYAEKAGLEIERVLESVSSGAAGSWSLSNLAPRMLRGDFAPGFFVDHFVKDMGMVLDESRRMQLALPGLALAHQLYLALQAQGHGLLGTQSLLLALKKLNSLPADA